VTALIAEVSKTSIYKPVDELARTQLSFERPTRLHRTATISIICNFHWGPGYTNCFLSQSFKPNELRFNTVFCVLG